MTLPSMTGTVWPPPRFLTLIDESVLLPTAKVLTWVGRSLAGGGRLVNLGFQRMALAVVSWLATASELDKGGVERVWRGREEVDCAVVEEL